MGWMRGLRLELGWMDLRVKRLIAIFLLIAGILGGSGAAPGWAIAAEEAALAPVSGGQIFEQQCAGCHLKGGNIVRRGKTLKLKALQRNQVDSLEAIASLVTQGKGNMSAYGDRLTPEEIRAVSAYVLDQAESGWH